MRIITLPSQKEFENKIESLKNSHKAWSFDAYTIGKETTALKAYRTVKGIEQVSLLISYGFLCCITLCQHKNYKSQFNDYWKGKQIIVLCCHDFKTCEWITIFLKKLQPELNKDSKLNPLEIQSIQNNHQLNEQIPQILVQPDSINEEDKKAFKKLFSSTGFLSKDETLVLQTLQTQSLIRFLPFFNYFQASALTLQQITSIDFTSFKIDSLSFNLLFKHLFSSNFHHRGHNNQYRSPYKERLQSLNSKNLTMLLPLLEQCHWKNLTSSQLDSINLLGLDKTIIQQLNFYKREKNC